MNETDPLDQLRDIHAPPPPSFWPLPVGYWIALGLILTVIFLWLYFYLKNRPTRAIKRQAQTSLNRIASEFEGQKDVEAALDQIAGLMRRLLLSFYPKNDIAKKPLLHLSHLGQNLAPKMKSCSRLFEGLSKKRYQKNPDADISELILLTKTFIKQCKR